MKDNSNSDGKSQSATVGVIYKITNTINGKIYVGQTRQKLNKRISGHKHSQRKLGVDAAIRKYGWESFTVEIIETCPVEQLNEREIFWIASLNSKAPNGYNLTDGGEGLINPSEETRAKMSANHPDISGEKNPNYGKKTPPEVCAKISAANKGKHSHQKGKKHSEETRAKISANHADVSGEKNPNYGKKHSPETRKKISASKSGENNPLFGKHHSAETCSKISIALKAHHAKKKLESQNNS